MTAISLKEKINKAGATFHKLFRHPKLKRLREQFNVFKIIEDESVDSESTKPLSLQIGYFPAVSEKDIRIYAISLAQSAHVSEDLSYVGVYRFLDGYAYEVHEGGPCKALLPSIFKVYEKSDNTTPDTPVQVYLNTVARTLLVEIHHGGLTSYMLPENKHRDQSPEVVGAGPLERISFNNVHRIYEASKIVVLAGLLFLGVSLLVKPEVPAVSKAAGGARFAELPVAQWKKAAGVMTADSKLTIKYSNGVWTTTTKEIPPSNPVKPEEGYYD